MPPLACAIECLFVELTLRHVALRSYVIEDGICFLCLAKQAHARKQTFTFLHAVKNAFVGELQQQHGPECVASVSTAPCLLTQHLYPDGEPW